MEPLSPMNASVRVLLPALVVGSFGLLMPACGSDGSSVGTGGAGADTGAGADSGIGSGSTAGSGSAPGTGGTAATATSIAGKYASYFPVGVAIAQSHLDTVQPIVDEHFNHITAENAMKFGSVSTAEGVYDWTEADALADYARARGIKMTGHAIVWHRQTPSWLFTGLTAGDPTSIETLKARLKAHVDVIVPRYADVVDNWDVVNEAISDDGSKDYRDGSENSQWYEIFGSEEYVYWAYKYTYDALEAIAPGTAAGKLYYNDYNENLKADRIITMLDAVRAGVGGNPGVPVDGVGMQSHLRVDWPSITEIEQTLQKFVTAGYKVKVSELDVSLYNDYPEGEFVEAPEVEFTQALETEQATRYGQLFALYREHAASISSVTVWGVSDDATWLDNEPVEGRDDYPLLFDDAKMPKDAVTAILDF